MTSEKELSEFISFSYINRLCLCDKFIRIVPHFYHYARKFELHLHLHPQIGFDSKSHGAQTLKIFRKRFKPLIHANLKHQPLLT